MNSSMKRRPSGMVPGHDTLTTEFPSSEDTIERTLGAANLAFVDFDLPGQQTSLARPWPAIFVQHSPRDLIADVPKLALQLQSGDAGSRRGHQVRGPKTTAGAVCGFCAEWCPPSMTPSGGRKRLPKFYVRPKAKPQSNDTVDSQSHPASGR